MAKRDADVTPDFFLWLVHGRSSNQAATLRLYKAIYDNEEALINNPVLFKTAQELTGVIFSLWRAIFLSDTTIAPEQALDDMKSFMISLISDNTVVYNTDKVTRNWSFRYYLNNAVNRLDLLAADGAGIVLSSDFGTVDSDKGEWIRAQEVCERAIGRLENALQAAANPPRSDSQD